VLLLTAALEFAWYGLATGIDPLAVLWANLAFPASIRPAPIVFAAGLIMMAIGEAVTPIRQAARPMSVLASPRPSE
jgi:hypothetical protein